MSDNTRERAKALATFLVIPASGVEVSSFDDTSFDADGGEYRVLDDEEADEAWAEWIDSYIDDCILPEVNLESAGNAAQYFRFDRDAFHRDAQSDGRGHALSGYDGEEGESDCGQFFIYRTN